MRAILWYMWKLLKIIKCKKLEKMSANYTANVKDNWNAECTGETTHILNVNKK